MINIIEIFNDALSCGIYLYLENNELKYKTRKGSISDELKNKLKAHKAEIINYLQIIEAQNLPHLAPIHVSPDKPSKLPLSQSQMRLWLTVQKDPASRIYNIPVIYTITGELNVSMLEASVNHIIARHDSLRTRFVMAEGVALQEVEPSVSVRLPVIPADEMILQRELEINADHVFNLGVAPLMRSRLLQAESGEYYLILNFHHIVTDGWSIQSIFMSELIEYYTALSTGREVQLAPLTVQYTDYALWQQSSDIESQKRYWQETLMGYEDTLCLPTDFVRQRDSGRRGRYYRHRYSDAFKAQFERFNQQQGTTYFMGFLAAFAVLFYRYTDKEDLCIGTTVAGRYALELEPLIGFFVNILPLRIRVQDAQTVRAFMQSVRQLALDAFDHQVVSYEQILEGYGSVNDGRKNPLVPIIFRHQNFPKTAVGEFLPGDVRFSGKGLELDEFSERDGTRCELELSSSDDAQGLVMEVEYASDLYTRETIEQLLSHHEQILLSMFADANRRLGAIEVLTPSDREWQLSRWNQEETVELPAGSLLDAYMAQSLKTPQAVVCIDPEGQSYSYAMIEQQARVLAGELSAQGIGQGDRVGLYLDRDHRLLVSMLGIWGVGAAYIPLDPAYPADYVSLMLQDAAPQVVVSLSRYQTRLSESFNGPVMLLDDPADPLLHASSRQRPFRFVQNSSDDLAYLMYTSGSTGRPKAVKIPHRQLNNWCSHINRHWPFEADEVIAQKTTMAFAVSVKELFAGVVCGCPVVFITEATSKDPRLLLEVIQRYGITRINLVPSHVGLLLDAVEGLSNAGDLSLRLCTTAGEPLTAEQVMRCREQLPQMRLLNNYGCTELNDVTYYDTAAFDGSREFVPIGRPIQNTQVYVLDREKRLVPVGVAGELHVASVGMSLGYDGQEALTAERYSTNPWGEGLLYNTGDVVKYLADGQLEYLQRWDFQVKVRGHRVDVRQVEKVLGEQPGIGACAVVFLTEQQQLAGYYQVLDEMLVDETALRSTLSGLLPAYMVPDVWQVVEVFARLPNGKLDRRALMALELSRHQDDVYEALESETEQQLARIWSEVLDVPLEVLGRQSNFFTLGGHSLTAVKVISKINNSLDVDLSLSELFESPAIQAFATVIHNKLNTTSRLASYRPPANLIPSDCTQITPEMVNLMDLSEQEIALIAAHVPGGMRHIQDIYPLAPLQTGILFHHMMDPLNDPYVMSWLFRANTQEVVSSYIQGLQGVIDRHDAFRTAIFWQDLLVPVQVVLRQARLSVNELILDPGQDAQEQLDALRTPDQQRMDITQAPLVRLQVAQIPHTEQYFVLLQIHHLISDNSAGEIIQTEMAAYRQGTLSSLAAPVPYRNFVARTQYQAEHHDANAFFTQMLGDVDESTTPFGLMDVKGDGRQIAEIHTTLPEDLAHRIRQQAKRLQVSPAIIFHTAWAMVIASCSGRDDVVFGTVLSGRLEGGLGSEHMLGVFINTLPLRVKLHQSVTDGVQQIQQDLLALLPYEQTALTVAQGCSGVPKGSPLFSAILNYRHSPAKPQEPVHEDAFTYLNTRERTNYPLSLTVDDLGVGFGLEVQVDSAVNAEGVLAYVKTALAELVQALTKTPQSFMTTLSIIPQAEQAQLLAWNQTETDYPGNSCIHELFEDQVNHNPHATAVIFEDQHLTYQELNSKANQLAHYLQQEKHIKPDSLVGICIERSIEMVIAILGILKAGGAYVPLDPDYPNARLAYLLDDAKLTTVMTQRPLLNRTPMTEAQAVCLDDEDVQQQLSRHSTQNPDNHAGPHFLNSRHLAYVIYTSGSTGNPKGVMAPHCSIVNRVSWMEQQFPALTDEVFCQKTASGFVDHVAEIFQALAYGKPLVIIRTEDTLQADNFSRIIAQHKITRLTLVPSLLKLLIEQSTLATMMSLRLVISSGEALQREEAQNFYRALPRARLLNLYGSSEVGADVTAYLAESVDTLNAIPIGRPIHNIQLQVLNEHLQSVPLGIAGELHIGGVGLARGYLHRTELTAEKFIANPFYDNTQPQSANNSERLYKTGDVVRYLADGNLEYLGRIDHQVKMRGFRIELGEIENTLRNNESVKEAIVVAKTSATGDQQLVAYVVAPTVKHVQPQDHHSADMIDALRQHLSQHLPDYMIPVAFVLLDFLPLTANGKIDRRALPDPDLSQQQKEYIAPVTETEKIVCAIWQEVLGVERVGITDNFFQVGGDSLLATRLISLLRKKFTLSSAALSLKDIFETPYVSALVKIISQCIENKMFELDPILINLNKPKQLPLSQSQQRLWLTIQKDLTSRIYNIPVIYTITGALNISLLEASINHIIARQDSLRTRFVMAEGVALQEVEPNVSVTLPVMLANYETYQREIRANWNYVFDLGLAPLMRCRLLQVQDSEKEKEEQEFYLILNFHHIVTDGWSIQSIFMSELIEYYTALSTGREVQLAPLTVQYTDYALWQQSADIESQKRYWQETLMGYEDTLCLPTDFMRQRDSGRRGRYYRHRYSDAFKAQFERFNQQQGTTYFMGFLAAFAVLFYRYTDKEDLCIGTTVAGRYALELEPLIGFFVNILPLRIRVQDAQTVKAFMQSVRQLALDAFDHQVVSYEQILEGYGSVNDGRKNPLVPIIFRHQNFPKTRIGGALLGNVKLAGRGGWSAEEVEDALPERDGTRCELELSSSDDAQGLVMEVEYASDLYTRETIEQLLSHHEQILLSMFADANRRLGAIEVLTPSDREWQLSRWNQEETVELPAGSLLDAYMAQSLKTPQAVVCIDPEGQSYSYAMIEQQARVLAGELSAQGIGQGDRVGLYLDRDHRLLVSMLGIWGVGAAYIPLDPAYPADYVSLMLQDAAPQVVVSLSRYQTRLSESFNGPVMLLDDPADPLLHASSRQRPFRFVQNSSDDLAYLMYTSGSTGRPKAVKIPHRQLNNWCSHINRHWPFEADEVIAQKTTMAFAVSVKELFAGVVCGCPVVFITEATSKDPRLLLEVIQRYGITRINLVPSHVGLLLDAVEGLSNAGDLSLRLCTTAGEPLTAEQVMRCREQLPQMRLLNNYGCTELNDVTYYDTAAFDGSREFVPIGRPIQNTQVYVLDREKRLVPVGVAGELHVASVGMSLGYDGQEALTAERYSTNPWGEGLLYNTGDVVKYLADGQLEYLQRWDFQVKVRGHRVDVRQVEKVLGEQPGIGACAVVFLTEQQQLAGYYQVLDEMLVDETALRSTLSGLLPAYMVPDVWQVVEVFARLPNGKLDRRALMALELSRHQDDVYEALESETEQQLARIWSEVLDVPLEVLGRQSNFFTLGGHSLTAVKVISKINNSLDVDLLVADLISHPTIVGIASVLENRSMEFHYSYKYNVGDKLYSLPNKQLLFKSTFQHHWNITGILNLIEVDTRLLEKTLRTILYEHQGLRYQFFVENNWVLERIIELDDKPILDVIDLSKLDNKKEQSNNIEIISNQLQSTLNLSKVLYKFVLFVCGDDEPARLLWIVHHALADRYSMSIFMEDLFMHYMSNLQEINYSPRPATTSVAEWGNYLHQYVNSKKIRGDIDYWTSLPWCDIGMLVDHPEGIEKNKSQDTNLYGKDIVVIKTLDSEYSHLLQSGRWDQANITTANIIFAAFTTVVSRLTKNAYTFFDILAHGRDNIIPGVDLTRTIGWLAAYVPVVIKVDHNLSAPEKVQSYSQQYNQIPSSGLSFNALKYLSDDPSIRKIFEAMPTAEFNINYLPVAAKELDRHTHNNTRLKNLPIPIWTPSNEFAGDDHGARHADIIWPSYINISHQDGVYAFTWIVRDNVYDKKTIERAVESWLDEIKLIVDSVRRKVSVELLS